MRLITGKRLAVTVFLGVTTGIVYYQWRAGLLSPARLQSIFTQETGIIIAISGVDTYYRRRYKETMAVIRLWNQEMRAGVLKFMADYDRDVSDTAYWLA